MKWTDIGVACAAVAVGIACSGAPASAQQRTAKECAQEWTANKAAIQASGKTKKAFVAECRGQTAAAAPTQTRPAPGPTATQQAAPQTTPRSRQTPMSPTAGNRQAPMSPTAGNQFATEVQARAHCPSDNVVWVNLNSGVYHFAGARDYGRTKRGAYMCERETAGFRAAKNEKRP